MTALDKTTRRKVFYAMAVLFALVVPAVLLYSRGYVIDFRSRGLVATGGIFVKAVQPGVQVFVDSNFAKETSFIGRGALITNLLPRRYAVRIEKSGFRPWQKVVRISNEEVLEFRNVFLPPATITPRAIFSARGRASSRLTALAGRPELGIEAGGTGGPFTVFVVNPETQLSPLNFIQVTSWFWDESAEVFIIGRRVEGQMRWFRLPFGGGREEPITFRGLPAGFSAESVQPHPTRPGELYFFAGGALFLQGRSSVPIPIAEQIYSYAITPEHLYFISKTGFFAESDLEGHNTMILGRKGLFLTDDAPARIISSPGGDVAVLDSAGGLFLYRPGRDQELELISGNIAGVDFSAESDRMLFWDEHRLWVYWLKDNPRQPFDLARSKKQVFYSEEPILRAFLNPDGTYIFFATANGIRMVESDERGSANSYTLVENPVESFLLDKQNLILYWTQGATLFQAVLK